MTYLALVRHGQSEWNLENRFTGWVDVDLTDQGRAEAKKAGALFEGDRDSLGGRLHLRAEAGDPHAQHRPR